MSQRIKHGTGERPWEIERQMIDLDWKENLARDIAKLEAVVRESKAWLADQGIEVTGIEPDGQRKLL